MATPGMPITPSALAAMATATAPVVPAGSQIRVTTPLRQANAVLYQQFLDAFNTSDHERIGQLIAPTFVDHHPGLDISGLASFQDSVREWRKNLRLQVETEDILQADDRVITRVRFRGKHVGTVLGIPPTGREVEWCGIEIWRVSNGRLAERWAYDDMHGLCMQLAADAENIALVHRVADAANAREYDALDELFAPAFIDHNPAWSVRGLDELKCLIKTAAETLDFCTRLDQVYAADGGRVVMHITFSGTHIGPLFGRIPTGRQVEWTSVEVCRIEEGKIVERWVQADTAGLMHQLGVPLPQ